MIERGVRLTGTIPEDHLSRISAFIAARMGLHFPRERWRDLERGINAAGRELGIKDGRACAEWLLSASPTRRQIEILASHLTVGETYFLRDKRLFKALAEFTLPELIRLRRNSGKYLRIWSAGCSSGEEPYSIAILLNQMISDIADWNITIMATDINPCFLQKAAEGVYGRWSFRDTELGIKERFFTPRGEGRFEILSRIKDMVTFTYLNLAEDMYPSLINNTNALDIIFCRNVLMYFVPALRNKVVQRFYRALVEGGLLIVSASEFSPLFFPRFATIRESGTILYKREDRPGVAPCGPPRKLRSTFKPALDVVPATARDRTPAGVRTAPPAEARNPPLQSKAPETDTRSGSYLYREASALYREGCYREAMEKTEKLLSEDPLDASGLSLLARIYANWGKLDKALEACEKAIASEKLHAEHHYLMATIQQELGRTEDAVASFRKTLYLDPGFILAYVALGNISRKHGRGKESLKHFQNALSLLNAKRPEDMLPESEGMNAERLTEIIRAMQQAEVGR